MDLSGFESEDLFHFADLIKQYEEALRKNRSLFFDHDDFEDIIDYYEEIGEFEKALKATEKALEQHSFSAMLVLRQAQLEFELKNCDKALFLVERVLALDASEIGALLLRAEILSFQSKYDEAIIILENLEAKVDGDDLADVYLQFCDVYEDSGNYPKVFEYLKKCLYHDSSNDEAINRMNYVVEILQNYQESINFHQEIIDKHPYNYYAWYNLATGYKALGSTKEAINALEFVIAINNEADFAYIDLAELHLNQQEYSKALETINEINDIFESDEELHILQGKCYDAQANYKMARYYYRKALQENPTLSEVYYRIGETYKKEGLWSQAFKAFRKATDLEKEQYEFCLALAEAAIAIKEFDVGIDACQTAIDIFINREEAYYTLAKIFVINSDNATALEILEKGMDICKKDTTLILAKISALYLSKKIKEADVLLQEYCVENKIDPNLMYNFHEDLRNDVGFNLLITPYL